MPILTQTYHSPVGELRLGSINGKLCLCDWYYRDKRTTIDQRILSALDTTFQKGEDATLAQTKHELDRYFTGEAKTFDVPILLIGTPFQQRVWQALQQVAYNTTQSYQDVANRIEHPAAVRAVANANGANALSIIVPCHRIVGRDGSLTGYAGGLAAKKALLALESQGTLPL